MWRCVNGWGSFNLWQTRLNCVLGCIRQSITIRSREVIPPHCLALVRRSWNAESNSEIPRTRKTWSYWRESNKGPQTCLKDWSTSYMEKDGLSLFSLEKRFKGGSYHCVLIPKGRVQEGLRQAVFHGTHCQGKGNDHGLGQKRFCPVQVTEHWHRLLRGGRAQQETTDQTERYRNV